MATLLIFSLRNGIYLFVVIFTWFTFAFFKVFFISYGASLCPFLEIYFPYNIYPNLSYSYRRGKYSKGRRELRNGRGRAKLYACCYSFHMTVQCVVMNFRCLCDWLVVFVLFFDRHGYLYNIIFQGFINCKSNKERKRKQNIRMRLHPSLSS